MPSEWLYMLLGLVGINMVVSVSFEKYVVPKITRYYRAKKRLIVKRYRYPENPYLQIEWLRVYIQILINDIQSDQIRILPHPNPIGNPFISIYSQPIRHIDWMSMNCLRLLKPLHKSYWAIIRACKSSDGWKLHVMVYTNKDSSEV